MKRVSFNSLLNETLCQVLTPRILLKTITQRQTHSKHCKTITKDNYPK